MGRQYRQAAQQLGMEERRKTRSSPAEGRSGRRFRRYDRGTHARAAARRPARQISPAARVEGRGQRPGGDGVAIPRGLLIGRRRLIFHSSKRFILNVKKERKKEGRNWIFASVCAIFRPVDALAITAPCGRTSAPTGATVRRTICNTDPEAAPTTRAAFAEETSTICCRKAATTEQEQRLRRRQTHQCYGPAGAPTLTTRVPHAL
jgi:hypothetical protein